MNGLVNNQHAVNCPALFLAAPASGQGKTTVTAAMARFHKNCGRKVRVFKMGPDYLDPQILEQASGYPVQTLDMWMAGIEYCRHKLYEAAVDADLILIEGAMGMFDGEPASVDVAAAFNIPVAIIMDVKGMAQTAAAVALGLVSFRRDFCVAGLIANNCGSERHASLIKDSLPEAIPLLATLARDDTITLPERHLGLVQASEQKEQLERRLDQAAQWISTSNLTPLPDPVVFEPQRLTQPGPLLQGKKIAVARDGAFSFIYADNLNLLQKMGAELFFFSPLNDQIIPDTDALWLPGGYPELHAAALADNRSMILSLQNHFYSGRAMLAECGGMLYCLESITDLNETSHALLGILLGHSAMRGRRGCQGMQVACLPEGEVRAHAHHRSQSFATPTPIAYGKRQRHSAPGEAIYRVRGLTASFLHLFFPSNPEAIAALFSPALSRVEPVSGDGQLINKPLRECD